MIWWFSLKQLYHSTPDAPDIGGRRSPRKLDDLGGHPVWGPHDLGLLVWPSKRAGRDAKVSKLDGAVLGRQDVGTLDISVNNTLIVEILQTLEDLRHVHTDEIFRELPVGFTYR